MVAQQVVLEGRPWSGRCSESCWQAKEVGCSCKCGGVHHGSGVGIPEASQPEFDDDTSWPVTKVRILEGRRALNEQAVRRLVFSVREVGLLNPVVVRPDGTLVAGYHRLEAVKRLGWRRIPVQEVSLDEDRAKLAEIDENLVRNEGTALDRTLWLKEKQDVYERLYPETRHGYGPGRGHVGEKRRNGFVSFAVDTAAKAGVTPRTIQTEVRVGRALEPFADELKGTKVEDSKKDLLELAKAEPKARKKAVQLICHGKAKNSSEALRLVARETAPPIAIPDKVSVRILNGISPMPE